MAHNWVTDYRGQPNQLSLEASLWSARSIRRYWSASYWNAARPERDNGRRPAAGSDPAFREINRMRKWRRLWAGASRHQDPATPGLSLSRQIDPGGFWFFNFSAGEAEYNSCHNLAEANPSVSANDSWLDNGKISRR
jgi:hypothetical protein